MTDDFASAVREMQEQMLVALAAPAAVLKESEGPSPLRGVYASWAALQKMQEAEQHRLQYLWHAVPTQPAGGAAQNIAPPPNPNGFV